MIDTGRFLPVFYIAILIAKGSLYMNKTFLRIALILLTLLMVFSIVACNNEAQPEPEPEPKECVVTFDSQGGSPIASVTVMEGEKVKQPSTNPTREGFYFGGWYKDPDYKSKYKFSAAVTDDITIYARWWNTEYYMPAGWSSKVTTPMWTTKDEGTVTVPDAILQGDFKTEVTNVTKGLEDALTAALADPDYFKDVKNVIVIISDGMGITHVKASEQWSGDLIMTKLPNVGVSKTKTREDILTDSAAGGTALATGYKTTRLFASIDAEGNNLKSVSELAREQGKLVGIVTNAELADATPAVYSIHNKNRSQGWTKMCEQEVVFGADLFMGNGYSDYSGYFSSSNELYSITETKKIKLYKDATAVVSHFEDPNKMWAIFNGTANKFARFDTTSTSYPNLQQMTAYALSWLDAHDTSDKGFVVMIENTYTDHFGHGNAPNDGSDNTFGIVKEVQSTDEAVAIALKYVLEHPDTALIVTADHETGDTKLITGWEDDFTKIIASSGDHSTQNVPVFAIGKGTEALNSLERTEAERAAGAKWDEATPYENYRIGQVVGNLLGDAEFGGDVNTDNSSKTSPKFDVMTKTAANELTFTLEMTGAWIQTGNYIQFKIKPISSSDKITVSVAKDDGTPSVALKETAFSSTNGITKPEMDSKGYCLTPLMRAFNQAFIEKSGFADGWYQVSVPSTAKGNKLVITLTSTSGIPAGSTIGMDDLTIQFASTIGYIKFSSNNSTASGACLVP